jgi:hypothetical protein
MKLNRVTIEKINIPNPHGKNLGDIECYQTTSKKTKMLSYGVTEEEAVDRLIAMFEIAFLHERDLREKTND